MRRQNLQQKIQLHFPFSTTKDQEKLIIEIANFVETIEKRTGRKISCLEEIALETNKINLETLIKGRKKYRNSEYGIYLDNLINKY